MNRQVNLTKRIRTSNGLRYCPVVISPNGRLKPDYVLIADKEERHAEGAYYLEWYEGSRRLRRSVGKDAATAAARRHRQEQILASKAAGIKSRYLRHSRRLENCEPLKAVVLLPLATQSGRFYLNISS